MYFIFLSPTLKLRTKIGSMNSRSPKKESANLDQIHLNELFSHPLFNHLPTLILLIDSDHTVIQANSAARDYFQLSQKDQSKPMLSSLLEQEVYKNINSHFRKLIQQKKDDICFDLEMSPRSETEKKRYELKIIKTTHHTSSRQELYLILAYPSVITDQTQGELNHLFSSIPLGIFSLDEDGLIQAPYSSFTEVLLGQAHLNGKHLNQVLFAPCLDRLKPEERSAITHLFQKLKSGASIEPLRTQLPETLHYITTSPFEIERYLGITYKPIVHHHKMEKLLIILEDKTEVVQLKNSDLKKKTDEQRVFSRFLQVRNCSSDLFPVIATEIDQLLHRLSLNLKNKDDSKELLGILHTLKGNSRVAGFTFLTQMTHETEAKLLEVDSTQIYSFIENSPQFINQMSQEWSELQTIYRGLISKADSSPSTDELNGNAALIQSLMSRYHELLSSHKLEDLPAAERVHWALSSFHLKPLSSLEEFILLRASQTAKELKKKVVVHFNWEKIQVSKQVKSALSDIFLHLITNSIVHGIELPEQRQHKGKPTVGSIFIRAFEVAGYYHIELEDDGAGFDIEKIKKTAKLKKLASDQQLSKMSSSEIIQLTFRTGLSTASEVNTLAGRGIGLISVDRTIHSLKGNLSVRNAVPQGAIFQITLPSSKTLPLKKSCFTLQYFLNRLERQMREVCRTRQVQDLKLILPPQEMTLGRIFYSDADRLIVALSSIIGNFISQGSVSMSLEMSDPSELLTLVIRKDAPSWNDEPEFSLSMGTSQTYLRSHEGKISLTENELKVEFGMLVALRRLPPIFLGLDEDIQESEAQPLLERVKTFAHSIHLPIEVVLEPSVKTSKTPNLYIRKLPNPREICIPLHADDKIIEETLLKLLEKVLAVLQPHIERSYF